MGVETKTSQTPSTWWAMGILILSYWNSFLLEFFFSSIMFHMFIYAFCTFKIPVHCSGMTMESEILTKGDLLELKLLKGLKDTVSAGQGP